MCNCIHELLNVFEDSAQRERTISGVPQPVTSNSTVPMSIDICFASSAIVTSS